MGIDARMEPHPFRYNARVSQVPDGTEGTPAQPAWTGILLAGGESRRMGAEKPLQKVGGIALIESVAAAVAPCVVEMVVVTNRPELYGYLGLRIVPDMQPGRGPLAGIQSGLRDVIGRGSGLAALVVAVDYPFLQTSLLERILRSSPEKDVVAPRIEGRLHPLCARWASRTLGAVEEALRRGELSVHALIDRLDTATLSEEQLGGPETSRAFFNVNTPDDLRRAEAMLAQAHPRE